MPGMAFVVHCQGFENECCRIVCKQGRLDTAKPGIACVEIGIVCVEPLGAGSREAFAGFCEVAHFTKDISFFDEATDFVVWMGPEAQGLFAIRQGLVVFALKGCIAYESPKGFAKGIACESLFGAVACVFLDGLKPSFGKRFVKGIVNLQGIDVAENRCNNGFGKKLVVFGFCLRETLVTEGKPWAFVA